MASSALPRLFHPADAAASPPFAWRSVPGIELFEAVGICAYVEVCDLQVLEHTRTPVYAVKLDRRLVQRRMGVDTHRFGAARVALTNRHGLTKEEARVALLVAERRTNREISAALHKSLHTVRHQVETMMLKLGVESRLKVYEALMASSSPVDGNVPGHRKRCLGAE
jgi:DNA-binding CsgD family transcriptional regulator